MTLPSATGLQRTFFALAIPLLVAAILYWAQVVLVPMALAILLAFVLTPPVAALEQRGLRRAFSVPLVALLTFTLLGALAWGAASQVSRLAAELPGYEDNINRKLTPVYALLERLEKVEHDAAASLPPVPPGTPGAPGEKPTPVVVQTARPSVLAWIPTLARPVLDVAARTLLVLVLTVFILAQRELLRDRLLRLSGPRHIIRTTKAMDDASRRVSRFLLLQTATNACMGLGVMAGLALLGVPYALLWGLLAATLRFIPYVGIWAAALLPFALTVATFPGWERPLLVLGLFLALELLMFNVIEPLLFGHGTGVSALALLIAAVFWAWLWGPIGLFLSTPLTVCLVVLGKHVPGLRFFDVLLGDEEPLDCSARYYQRLLAHDPDEAAFVLEEHLQASPVAEVYDTVILPALARARADREEGRLSSEDERFVFRATRDLLDDVVAHHEPAGRPEEGPGGGLRILACPARGRLDTLALEMLRRLLRPKGCALEVVPRDKLLTAVGAGPDGQGRLVVCLAAVSPGSLPQACSLAKRLRVHDPAPVLVVGRWGRGPDTDTALQCLRKAGVDYIGTSLRETCDWLAAHVEQDHSVRAAHAASLRAE
jgi:predicted PurR-regulated permease PerM